MDQPTLKTDRLILRPLALTDAKDVQRLAGEREIADTTLNIPHPYVDGAAEAWISTRRAQFEAGDAIVYALTDAESGELIGAVGLQIEKDFDKAELGYWIGKPYWNNGYATEAAARLVRYGFEELELNRVLSRHLSRNPASGRVMQKLGMVFEGTLRQDTKKWDKYEDLCVYGLLREEWSG